jgi:HEPN domain-containing protein
MRSPRDHARALLGKAASDLVAAEATIATRQALDTVCFHAQQAAEKSLKALLALRDVEYPWRHDLAELLAAVKPLFPEVAPLEDGLVSLSPYAVEIRYGDAMVPDLKEASAALDVARQMHELAERLVEEPQQRGEP